MLKYDFINVANFKNGLSIPVFRVFDTDSRKTFYRAYVYGRDQRGTTIIKESFEHKHKSQVMKWRESRSHDER